MSINYSIYKDKKKKAPEGEFAIPPEYPDNMPSSFSKGQAKLYLQKDEVFEYKNYHGETVFWVKRDEATKSKKKKFTPFSYVGKKNSDGKTIYTWQPRGWPKDRVLYGEDLLRNNKKPVIITVHEVLGKLWESTGVGFFQSTILRFLEFLIIKLNFDYYLTVSNSTRQQVLNCNVEENKVSENSEGSESEEETENQE